MTTQSDLVRQIAREKFEELASSIHAYQDPNGGWRSLAQLPRLSEQQRATILRAHPEIAEDIVLDAECLAEVIEAGPVEFKEYLAMTVGMRLESAIRQALFDQLSWLSREENGENELRTGLGLALECNCDD